MRLSSYSLDDSLFRSERSDCDILHAKIDLLFGRNVLFTKKMKTVRKLKMEDVNKSTIDLD